MLSTQVSNKKTRFEISDYIEISDPYESDLLGFSRIVGTDDIFMERFHYQRVPLDSESNIGAVEKRTVASLRLEYAWSQLSKDENIALQDRYMKLIEQNYYGFSTIRDMLYPVVKGFIKPLPARECHGRQRDYREEYYRKRMGNRYFDYDSDDSCDIDDF